MLSCLFTTSPSHNNKEVFRSLVPSEEVGVHAASVEFENLKINERNFLQTFCQVRLHLHQIDGVSAISPNNAALYLEFSRPFTSFLLVSKSFGDNPKTGVFLVNILSQSAAPEFHPFLRSLHRLSCLSYLSPDVKVTEEDLNTWPILS